MGVDSSESVVWRPFRRPKHGSMRQGQGIIDIVNGYLSTALFSGLVGLTLQVMIFVVSIAVGAPALLQTRNSNSDAALLGASLMATLIATLFYVATAGWNTTAYMIAALLVSFSVAVARQMPPSSAYVFDNARGVPLQGGN